VGTPLLALFGEGGKRVYGPMPFVLKDSADQDVQFDNEWPEFCADILRGQHDAALAYLSALNAKDLAGLMERGSETWVNGIRKNAGFKKLTDAAQISLEARLLAHFYPPKRSRSASAHSSHSRSSSSDAVQKSVSQVKQQSQKQEVPWKVEKVDKFLQAESFKKAVLLANPNAVHLEKLLKVVRNLLAMFHSDPEGNVHLKSEIVSLQIQCDKVWRSRAFGNDDDGYFEETDAAEALFCTRVKNKRPFSNPAGPPSSSFSTRGRRRGWWSEWGWWPSSAPTQVPLCPLWW